MWSISPALFQVSGAKTYYRHNQQFLFRLSAETGLEREPLCIPLLKCLYNANNNRDGYCSHNEQHNVFKIGL